MERLYCGGSFCFDYLKDNFKLSAAEDYRAIILKDVDLLLMQNDEVSLSDRLKYIGPFYFETDGMIDKDIVKAEKQQIETCTILDYRLA